MKLTPAFITLIMLLIVGGLIAAYLVKGLWAKEKVAPRPTTRTLPVAMQDLEPGTEITAKHIVSAPISIKKLTSRDIIVTKESLIGRIVKVTVKGSHPIQSSMLYPVGKRPALDVPSGMVAMSVGLSDGTAIVSGHVQPGQHVDVNFTPKATRSDERFRGGLTMTLFRGVHVLAVNQSTSSSAVRRSGNTVVLALTKSQANIMDLALRHGSIRMMYTPEKTNNGGITVSSEERVTLEEILGLKELPKPPKPFVTEIYRGHSRSDVSFVDGKIWRGDNGGFNSGYRSNGTDYNQRSYRGRSGRGYGRGANNSSDSNANPAGSPAGSGRTISSEALTSSPQI